VPVEETGMRYDYMTLPGHYPGTTRKRMSMRTRSGSVSAGDIVEYRSERFVVEAVEKQDRTDKATLVRVEDYGAEKASCVFAPVSDLRVVSRIGHS
jgi:hypothetical protein